MDELQHRYEEEPVALHEQLTSPSSPSQNHFPQYRGLGPDRSFPGGVLPVQGLVLGVPFPTWVLVESKVGGRLFSIEPRPYLGSGVEGPDTG